MIIIKNKYYHDENKNISNIEIYKNKKNYDSKLHKYISILNYDVDLEYDRANLKKKNRL
jgi:hypothetical protein